QRARPVRRAGPPALDRPGVDDGRGRDPRRPGPGGRGGVAGGRGVACRWPRPFPRTACVLSTVRSTVGRAGRHPAPKGATPMDLYRPAYPRSRGAAHYRRPGTSASYCGRTVEAAPTEEKYVTGVCRTCVKAEQRDRVAAEETAADRAIGGPTLAERAGMRYALVGKGRRVHYSNNDDTLCGREVTEYTDGVDRRHSNLCALCIRAA